MGFWSTIKNFFFGDKKKEKKKTNKKYYGDIVKEINRGARTASEAGRRVERKVSSTPVRNYEKIAKDTANDVLSAFRKTSNAIIKDARKDRREEKHFQKALEQQRKSKTLSDFQTYGLNRKQLREIDKSHENVGKVLKSTAKRTVGGYGSTLGRTTSAMRTSNAAINAAAWSEASNRVKGFKTMSYNEQQKILNPLRDKYRKQFKANDKKSHNEKILKKTDKLIESGAKDLEDVKKGKSKAGKFGVDLASGMLDFGADVGMGMLTGGSSLAPMFARATGQSAYEAEKEGAKRKDALKYGVASGGIELATEKLTSIAKPLEKAMGKGFADDLVGRTINKLANKPKNELGQKVVYHGSKTLASALGEGLEEMISEGLNPAVANKIYADAIGKHKDFNVKDVAYAGALGGAMGGLLGGGGQVVENHQINNADYDTEKIIKRAKQQSEDSRAYKTALVAEEKLKRGEKPTNMQWEIMRQDVNRDIEAQESAFDDVVNSAQKVMKKNGFVEPLDYIEGNIVLANNTERKHSEIANNIFTETQNESLAKAVADIETGIATMDTTDLFLPEEKENRAVFENVTGEALPTTNVETRQYLLDRIGKNLLKSAEEETMYRDDVLQGEQLTEVNNMGPIGQSAFISGYEKADNKDEYRSLFNHYYKGGKNNLGFETVANMNPVGNENVSIDDRYQMYNAGLNDSVNGEQSMANRIAIATNKAKASDIKLMSKVANRLGINIEITDNEGMQNKLGGEKQFSIEEAPNGFYENGKIVINIEADKPLSAIFSHELTHELKEKNPEAYKQFRDFVVEAWKNRNAESLAEEINSKIEHYKANGVELTEEEAIEEILADSTWELVQNEDIINELCKQNRSLAQSILDAIEKVIEKLKAILTGNVSLYEPRIEKKLYEELGIAEEVAKMWVDGISNMEKSFAYEDSDITFSSKDNKNNELTKVGNKNPSDDKDVSFSLKEPIEVGDKLIAMHNITQDKLWKALKLGGFPMPSLAVTKAKIGHTNFGDISLLFDKSTIDPEADSRNKVYGADAWTPVFPQIDYKLNEKKADEVYNRANKVGSLAFFNPVSLASTNLESKVKDVNGDSLVEHFKNDYGLKNMYLAEKGEPVKMLFEEKDRGGDIGKWFTENCKDEVLEYDKIKDNPEDATQYVLDNKEKLSEVYANYLRKVKKENEEYITKRINRRPMLLIGLKSGLMSGMDSLEGKKDKVENIEATEKLIDDKVNQADYEKWLKDLFAGIVEKEGVHNGKDPYTASGNRRSFEKLHYDVTLDNIVQAMIEQADNIRNDSAFFNGLKTIRAVATEDFGSLEEIRNGKNKLRTIENDNYDQLYNNLSDELANIISKIASKTYGSSNDFIKQDAIGMNIADAILEGNTTAEGLKKYLNKYGSEVTVEDTKLLENLIKEVANMPVNLFEAKPERSVRFDEVVGAVVPADIDTDLINALEEEGVEVSKYESDEDRIDTVNRLADKKHIMFSLKKDTAITYNSLIRKPAMRKTVFEHEDENVKNLKRKEIVKKAKENIVEVFGKKDEYGRLVAHVEDIGKDIVVGTPAISHGFTRDYETNAKIALNLGGYLKNAIKVNEIEARSKESVGGYILLGYGEDNKGKRYPAYFVVETLTGGLDKLVEFDNLYSFNGKKISEAVGGADRAFKGPTSDDISIAELIDIVKSEFTDILPRDVLEHFGINERRDTKLAKNVSYSLKTLKQDRTLKKLREQFAEGEAKFKEDLSPEEKSDLLNKNMELLMQIQRLEAKEQLANIEGLSKEEIDSYQKDLEGLEDAMREMGVKPVESNVVDVPVITDELIEEYNQLDDVTVEQAPAFKERAVKAKQTRNKSVAELEAQIEKLEKEKVKLRQETKLSYGKLADTKEIKKKVNQYIRELMGGKKTSLVLVDRATNSVEHIYKLIKEGEHKKAALEAFHTAIDVLEEVDFTPLHPIYDEYLALNEYLRTTPIEVSEAEKRNIPDYNYLRKEMFGKIRLVNGKGNIDSIGMELAELFPGFFYQFNNGEIYNEIDMLNEIIDVRRSFEKLDYVFEEEEFVQLAKEFGNDLIEIAVDAKPRMTVADKMKDRYDAKIEKLKAKCDKAIEDANEKLEKKYGNKYKKKIENELRKGIRKEERIRANEKRDKDIQKLKEKHKKKENERKDNAEHKKLKESIEKNLEWLSTRLVKPTDDKHIPEEFRKLVAEFLYGIDRQTARSKKLEEKLGKISLKTLNLQKLQEAYESVAKEDGSGEFEYDGYIAELIASSKNKLDGKSIDEADNKTLKELKTITDAIIHQVRQAGKNFNEKLNGTRAEVAKEIIKDFDTEIERQSNRKKNNKKGDYNYKDYTGLRGTMDKLLNEDMVTPGDFFELLGDGMYKLYGTLREGFDKHIINRKTTREMFAEVFKKYYRKKKPGSELEKLRSAESAIDIDLKNGYHITMTPAQIMSLYCLNKREQARGHIYGAGIVTSTITNDKGVKKLVGAVKQVQAETMQVTPNDVNNIISNLTEEQREIADKMMEFLNTTCAEWGNDASMKLFGYKKFTERNYFPIQSSDVYLNDSLETRQIDEVIKNFGFTKGTVVKANNPIVIADIFEVVADHVNKMSLYNAFAVPIADFQRIYNYKIKNEDGLRVHSVRSKMKKAYGEKPETYIKNFMVDLNNNSATKNRDTGLKRLFNKALANYKKAAIGFNLRVLVQQPTAVMRAMQYLGPQRFIGISNPMANLKEMKEHCPIALWKSWGYSETDVSRDVEDIMMNNEWSRLDMITMRPYGFADDLTWGMIWAAVKKDVKAKHKDVKEGSDEFWELCNKRASYIYDKTQVVDSPFHKSQIMRDKGPLQKMLTSFMAEPTRTFNMVRTEMTLAIRDYQNGDKANATKRMSRTITVFVANAALVSAVAAIIDALRGKNPDKDDKDEKKTKKELWWENFIANLDDNANPLNMIVGIKDFWQLKDGWGTSNMALEGAEALWKNIDEWNKYMNGESKKSQEELIKGSAEALGQLFGIPFKNVFRELKTFFPNVFAAESKSADIAAKEYEAREKSFVDVVLEFVGVKEKSKKEREQEAYDDRLKDVKRAIDGLTGKEAEEKAWETITKGYTGLAERGDFSTLKKMKQTFIDLGYDKLAKKFEEKIENKAKTGFKKSIGDVKVGEHNPFKEYLIKECGYKKAQFTDLYLKSDTAKEFGEAVLNGNDEGAVQACVDLLMAGASDEDLDLLWQRRTRNIDAKDYAEGTYATPVSGTVSSDFGYRTPPTAGASSYHQGIDIAAKSGSNVIAADGGKVSSVGYNRSAGNYVKILHGNGRYTVYKHLNDGVVLKGDVIKKGQIIGHVGSTGNSTGPHLHFEIIQDGRYLNPKDYL